MKVLKDCSDERLRGMCIYCGGEPQSRDHVPPKFFLDDPLPSNVHVVAACEACNHSYSQDEQFVGCLLNALSVGSVSGLTLLRPKVRATLEKDRRLALLIAALLKPKPDHTAWEIAKERVRNVLRKMALGHASYEMAEMSPLLHSAAITITATGDSEADELMRSWDASWTHDILPEVGSRAIQRLVLGETSWVSVQPENYRFRTGIAGSGVRVQMILLESFMCDVILNET